jgi:hypothetical protein
MLGVLALALLGGCADSRTPAPSLSRVHLPDGVKTVTYLHGRLRFSAPTNWVTQTGAAPMVVTLGSGPALITVWRYPRSPSQPLPADAAALDQARLALISAAGARDPTIRVISSAVVQVSGSPGVELDALETIQGRRRRVRSAHIYTGGAEIVIDEYAPVNLFHDVDRVVFSPLLRSVRLGG